MKHTIAFTWTLLVVCVLFLPVVLVLDGYKATAFENRALAKYPDIGVSGFFSTSSPGTELDNYFRDHLPLRYEITRFYNQVRFEFLGESPSSSVVLGKQGWLFMTNTLLRWPEAKSANPKAVLAALDDLIGAARSSRLPIAIVLSPDKASIYPEYLPDGWRERRLQVVDTRQAAMEDYANSNTEVLNMWATLRYWKENIAPANTGDAWIDERLRYLYRPRDRHWQSETGKIQAREIIAALGDKPELVNFPKLGKYHVGNAELSIRFLLFELEEPFAQVLGGVENKCHNNNSTFKPVVCENTHAPFKKSVVIIHDSFMNKSMPYLTSAYSQITFIHWNTFRRASDKISELVLSSDGFVVQTVDGFKGPRSQNFQELAEMIHVSTTR